MLTMKRVKAMTPLPDLWLRRLARCVQQTQNNAAVFGQLERFQEPSQKLRNFACCTRVYHIKIVYTLLMTVWATDENSRTASSPIRILRKLKRCTHTTLCQNNLGILQFQSQSTSFSTGWRPHTCTALEQSTKQMYGLRHCCDTSCGKEAAIVETGRPPR